MIVFAQMDPVSIVILIAKRTSRPLTGGRLAQCRNGLTKTVETSNRVKGSTISRMKDTGDVSDVDAALTSTSTPNATGGAGDVAGCANPEASTRTPCRACAERENRQCPTQRKTGTQRCDEGDSGGEKEGIVRGLETTN